MAEREVTLWEMLDARERRAFLQRELLQETGCPLISFMLNVPGPVKTSDALARAFDVGVRRIRDALRAADIPLRAERTRMERTGYEYYAAADCDADALKRLTTRIEEADALGRLFDIDVLGTDGRKRSRATPRACLICGREAHACARSRTHSLAELCAAVQAILEKELP